MDDNVKNIKLLEEVSSIEQRIDTIEINIAKIKKIQEKIIISVATTEEFALAQKRNQIVHNTREILNETKDLIKRYERNTRDLRSDHSDKKFRSERLNHLKEKFKIVLDTYTQAENTYLDQRKGRMSRQYKVVYPDATQKEIDDYLKNTFDQPIFTNALLGIREAKDTLAEVRKRHSEIIKIELTIKELLDLLKDLKLQVDDQDSEIVSTAIDIDIAGQKIVNISRDLNGVKVNKSIRRKKWLIAVITTIVILILVVLLIILLGENS
ncbi:409_t:CDS:1 [Diversispora eburnea]|uniref:409_t:CDS:1 n=1 Tax=Diversispora eburnea TaxID=1213867 RepID=A0A9N8ZAM7_9GLOM|nr:409_t:CDS:1 [Diversispora eburnea]